MAYKQYDYAQNTLLSTILQVIEDILCGTNVSGQNAGLLDGGWKLYDSAAGGTNKRVYWSNPRKTVAGAATPTTALSPTAAAGGSLAAGTYYLTYSWLFDDGETRTKAANESVVCALNDKIQATCPAFPANVRRARVYVSTTSGDERFTAELTAAGAFEITSITAGARKKPYRGVEDGGDNASDNVFITIDLDTAGFIKLIVHEAWNDSTNTATNLCYESDVTGYCQKTDIPNGGTLHISAKREYAILLSYSTANGWGSTSGSFSAVLTAKRFHTQDTVVLGVPSFGFWRTRLMNCYTPRMKDGTTITGAYLELKTVIGPAAGGSTSALSVANAYHAKHSVWELYGSNPTKGEFRGVINGIKVATYNNGASGDKLTIGTDDYMVVQALSDRLLMPMF